MPEKKVIIHLQQICHCMESCIFKYRARKPWNRVFMFSGDSRVTDSGKGWRYWYCLVYLLRKTTRRLFVTEKKKMIGGDISNGSKAHESAIGTLSNHTNGIESTRMKSGKRGENPLCGCFSKRIRITQKGLSKLTTARNLWQNILFLTDHPFFM